MFLSAQALAIEYGIDDRIAKFYVDREPPKDNLYWKDKLLYLRPQPGYIFLPLIADLFFKSGIPLNILLSEEYVCVLEKIGHYSAQQEAGLATYRETEEQSRHYVDSLANNREIFKEINAYFAGSKSQINSFTVPYKALHRGDVFLYSLCVLDLDREKLFQLVKVWFALISTLLLLDDAEDYLSDVESGEENAFAESAEVTGGMAELVNMISANIKCIESVNFSMAHALSKKLALIWDKPGVKQLSNF